jgi:hypothetical protein
MHRDLTPVRSPMQGEADTGTATEQGALLAAALAATLVEYRHDIEPDKVGNALVDDNTNWRILGRMEQLRSRA